MTWRVPLNIMLHFCEIWPGKQFRNMAKLLRKEFQSENYQLWNPLTLGLPNLKEAAVTHWTGLNTFAFPIAPISIQNRDKSKWENFVFCNLDKYILQLRQAYCAGGILLWKVQMSRYLMLVKEVLCSFTSEGSLNSPVGKATLVQQPAYIWDEHIDIPSLSWIMYIYFMNHVCIS